MLQRIARDQCGARSTDGRERALRAKADTIGRRKAMNLRPQTLVRSLFDLERYTARARIQIVRAIFTSAQARRRVFGSADHSGADRTWDRTGAARE